MQTALLRWQKAPTVRACWRVWPRELSFGAATEDDYFDSLCHDEQIEAQADVLYIEEVVFKFFAGGGDGVAVSVLNLRPTGDAWPHNVSEAIKRYFMAQQLYELGTFWTWTYKHHVSANYVPELRNFVQAS